MRASLLILAISLALVVSAGAVKLQTNATVQLVDPAEARLQGWTANEQPLWSVSGTPGEQVHLSLELQTADGRRLTLADHADAHSLDADGRILASLAAPATAAHEAIDVVTLVVCRE